MENNIVPKLIPNDKYIQQDCYELLSLYLEGESGQKVDLKPLYQNFTFVEDMFLCAISGSVIIKDAVNLFNTFPILGYEKLTVVFKTPGIGSKDIKKTFDVVEITDQVKSATERSQVYRINFISSAATKDKTIKISKSFKGKISDIAKKIYKDYIGGDLDAQDTLGENKYVIPRWSPFKALTWLSSRSIPAKRSKETNYLFFETVDGHRFISLSELVSEEPIATYFNIPVKTTNNSTNATDDLARNFYNVKQNLILKSGQKLKEQMEGAYSSTLYVHDITTKQWGRFVYNYNDDKDVRYLTKNKLTKLKDKFTSVPDTKILLTTKQTGLMGNDYKSVQNHEGWLQRSISSNCLLESIKIKISIAGNSLLRAGSIIEYYTPKPSSISNDDVNWYDEYFSGKYIITTIRHTITPQGYTNTLILSKNSYEKQIPDITNFMDTGKQKSGGLFRR